MDLYPHLTHFPENRLALEQERRLRREIRARQGTRRSRQPARIAMLTASIRRALRPSSLAGAPDPS